MIPISSIYIYSKWKFEIKKQEKLSYKVEYKIYILWKEGYLIKWFEIHSTSNILYKNHMNNINVLNSNNPKNAFASH